MIVFGAFLAVQSAFAEGLPKITAEEVLRQEKEQIASWSTQWSCTQVLRAGENPPYSLKSDGVGLRLDFDLASKTVSQRYRDAKGSWFDKRQNDFKTLFWDGGLAGWQLSIPSGYDFRLSAFAFKKGKFEQRFMKLASDLDEGFGKLTSIGMLNYDCVPMN